MKKYFVVCMALLFTVSAFGQTGTRVDVTNFEDPDTDWGIQMTGNNTLNSYVYFPSDAGAEDHQGENALISTYAITDQYNQQRITFGTPVDLTGMRELHFWVYFTEGSAMHHDGDYRLRVHGPNGHVFGEPTVSEAGVWTEIVLPIDRYSSSSELADFTHLDIIINSGSTNTDEGTILIDEIYGFRPDNTPTTREVLIFGFNDRDPETDAPIGWRPVADTDGFIMMGDAIVEPSEGSDYLESVMPGDWVRPLECVNALTINDAPGFTEWERVIEVMVDVQMSEDFSDGWHNFHLVLNSSAGGYKQYDIRSASNKGSWRTVAWDVDMAPYISALEDPDGWLQFSFITQTGNAGSSVYIDNLRVGIPTTYVAATRAFDVSFFQSGESIAVTLDLEAEGDAQDYELIEVLPTGWSATDISDGGVFADGVITWTVNVGTGITKSVSYTAVSPASASVDGAWSGSIGGLETKGKSSLFLVSDYLLEHRVQAPLFTAAATLDGRLGNGEYDGAYVENVKLDSIDDKTPPGVFIGEPVFPANDEFTIYAMHTSETIFVAIDVVDDQLAFDEVAAETWNNDSVEFFLDGNLSRSATKDNGPHGFQASVIGNGRLCGGNNPPTTIAESDRYGYSTDGAYWNYASRVKDDDSGWILEYAVDKSTVLDDPGRTLIGFDIKIDGSEPGAGIRTSNWGYWFTNSAGVVADGYWDDETGWNIMELQGGQSPVSEWDLY